MRSASRVLAALVSAAMLLAGLDGAEARTTGTAAVRVVTTSADGSRRSARLPDLPLTPVTRSSGKEIVIDTARTGPAVVGFGAAITDSSAELIGGLDPKARKALLLELFGATGLHLSFVRMPIGASDFSRQHYSLDDMPPGSADPAMAYFSMARPLAVQIPLLRQARAINPQLAVMASPWSAPGWMKDTDSLIKGSLKPEYEAAFAAYFIRFLDGMEQAGVPVRFVSMQNEPAFEPADYPGMRVSAQQRSRFFARHLGPALARRHGSVSILEWDHNWDKPQEPIEVLLDRAASRYVGGVAWHCYGGQPDVMEDMRRQHPEMPQFVTECSGGQWAPDWGETLGWMAENLFIAPSRAGSRGTILWNLALDPDHGPHLGGCGNCRGVVTIDPKAGTVTRNLEYYLLNQVSHFVRPGARVIASSGGSDGISSVAFLNGDNSRALLVLNKGATERTVSVIDGARTFAATVPRGEFTTFVWPGPKPVRRR